MRRKLAEGFPVSISFIHDSIKGKPVSEEMFNKVKNLSINERKIFLESIKEWLRVCGHDVP